MSNNTQRYEVVAPMPHFTHLMAMDILIPMVHPINENVPYWGREEDKDYPLNWVDFCPKFPHLFRPLKWWEHVPIDELPKYIKSSLTELVGQIEYELRFDGIYAKNTKSNIWHRLSEYAGSTIPATEAEYTEYLTKLNAKQCTYCHKR